MPVNAYREDLAYIHDTGHGDLARAAAQRVVEELGRVGFQTGTVVDLGCGSGILAHDVTQAGYSVVGIDVSDAMVAIARDRAPQAEFCISSFFSADFPTCVAVTAIGEVLNYAFDEKNDAEARGELFGRVYDALVPGGFLMFDMAGFDRATSAAARRTFSEGPDWAVSVETELDTTRHMLTRNITTFRQVGALRRRDTETHRLILAEPREVLRSLSSAGLEVQMFRGYGAEPLSFGLVGFLGRKPQRGV